MFQLSGFYYRLLLLAGSGTVALQVPEFWGIRVTTIFSRSACEPHHATPTSSGIEEGSRVAVFYCRRGGHGVSIRFRGREV